MHPLEVLALVVAFAAGAIIFWILRGNRSQETEFRLRAEQLAAEVAQRNAALERAEADRERLREQAAKVQAEKAAVESRLDSERSGFQEKLTLLSSAKEDL